MANVMRENQNPKLREAHPGDIITVIKPEAEVQLVIEKEGNNQDLPVTLHDGARVVFEHDKLLYQAPLSRTGVALDATCAMVRKITMDARELLVFCVDGVFVPLKNLRPGQQFKVCFDDSKK